MKKFEPIAIIGQGCVLPGCFSPQELWQMVYDNKVKISHAQRDAWRVQMNDVLVNQQDGSTVNRSWHNVGGYVTDFASHFKASDFNLGPLDANELDPVFQWSFYAAKQALQSSGYDEHPVLNKTGLIMGNLSYPGKSFSQYYEEKQLEKIFPDWKNPETSVNPINRFMSGLPAQLTARVMGLQGEAFAIDAACASSLYALKLACDKLHDGTADMMLVGGVCAADQLFLHVGFTALNALSPTGQSRPFNAAADGLIPAEGSAFIVIKKLADAIADDDNILGVIRGIGLSNDGRSGGFLSPSKDGQVRSMQNAFAQTDIKPADVSYIECHATGTSTGDAIEIESLNEVYQNASELYIGSLKGNIGHSITASGVAGIIKVLGAFENEILPPTPGIQPLNTTVENSSFQTLSIPKDWDVKKKRIAGISNFGFGGNNAHLILEEWKPGTQYNPEKDTEDTVTKVAIVGIEIQTQTIENANAYLQHLLGANVQQKPVREKIVFDLKGLNFPPNDLKCTLGQQLLVLNTTQNLLQKIKIDNECTGVFIGMGADTDINRYGFKKRVKDLVKKGGITISESQLHQLEEAIGPVLTSASVIGTMPNIPANRINNQFNITGMGYTISSEELSGLTALKIAINAIKNGELTTAIVGAVDMSDEYVQQQSLKAILGINTPMADAAVVMVLKSYDEAKKDADTIYATIQVGENNESLTIEKKWLRDKTGYSHASDGLLQLAAGALLTHNRLKLDESVAGLIPVLDGAKGFSYGVNANSLFGSPESFILYSEPLEQLKVSSSQAIKIHTFTGNDKQDLIVNMQKDVSSLIGEHRLAILCAMQDLPKIKEKAINLLSKTKDFEGWLSDNIHYRFKKINGEIAFAFTGAASAYPKMGKELLEAIPALTEGLAPYCIDPAFAAEWAYRKDDPKAKLPFYQLTGSSFICQVHAVFSKKILNIHPQAVIGLSSGETNSMYALGVWENMDNLLQDIDASDLYTKALGVSFDAVKTHWGLSDNEMVNWENWRALTDVTTVEKLIAQETRVYMTIVNTYTDCVFGGDGEACRRIIQQIGEDRVVPLHHDIAVHCEAVLPYEKEWQALHTRKSNTVPGIRFYSNYLDGVYETTSQNVAKALTGQAIQPIHFPRIVEKAWNDGVRVFVEHGPRNSLSIAIKDILKGKEHLCVSLDQFGRPSFLQACKVAAELWCAGLEVNLESLQPVKHTGEVTKKIELAFSMKMPQIKQPITVRPTVNKEIKETKVMGAAPVLLSTRSKLVVNAIPVSTNNVTAQTALISTEADVIEHLAISAAQKHDIFYQNSCLADVLVQQHKNMLDVHQNYLKTQLQAQIEFSDLMNSMLNHVIEPGQYSLPIAENIDAEEYVVKQVADVTDHIPYTPPTVEEYKAPEPVTAIKEKPVEITPVIVEDTNTLPGPKYSRKQLEILSSGKISSVLGPFFEQQDGYEIQVRMPEPPLLLCDRVTGIKGEPGTLGLGTIWTETDVTSTSWYLHNNRMPPGIFIEAGQADLLLISWLGIDFQNKGERSYRLLGCELTFFGGLPQIGETLKYDIHVDGYAKSGETSLFFFHYDCHIDGKLRISVRNGQAGFFSTKELEESKGIIWDEAEAEYVADKNIVLANATKKTSFTHDDVINYTTGNMVACFGNELDWTETHTRTPKSQQGYQNFIGEIKDFDLKGGPKGCGYLRAETNVTPNDWYFKGHFKNDECMPGTLMADACLQMMAFYMVGAGLSVKNDGWRFEPVTDEKYKFICRGQVTPAAKKVVYEIFISDISLDGKFPTIYAHVLTTVDGNRAFLCEKLGLRLVPDYPLNTMGHLLTEQPAGKKIASKSGFEYNYESLVNCALGKPADAFGPDFSHYDGIIRSPRLPGPPYHFMTRISEVNAVPGEYKNNPYVIAEYDLIEKEWYFNENGKPTMPFAVLMEVALQPCGWFSTYVCQHEIKGKDLLFRNLDGQGVQLREVTSKDSTIVTKTTLTGVSIMGPIIIVKFDVVSTSNGEEVFTMSTVFGFFDPESMVNQKGLNISEVERANFQLPSNTSIQLKTFPVKYFSESQARLPSSKLLMIDRITSYYPAGGKFGKGYIKAEKDVVKSEWFFKAHFFQDPVQPGSLGLEAMVQLIQFYMLEQGLHKNILNPQFEPISISDDIEWHYRGQVTPDKKMISADFDVREIIEKDGSVAVFGEARLWVDGLKIYHAPKIGMRMVESNQEIVKAATSHEEL